jgi:hypothetical protein
VASSKDFIELLDKMLDAFPQQESFIVRLNDRTMTMIRLAEEKGNRLRANLGFIPVTKRGFKDVRKRY